MPFKPLLASEAPESISFPVYASPKLDGIRGIVFGNTLMSRSMKSIPNKFVQKYFQENDLDGLDGELIVGDPNDKDVYRKTMSGVMSEDKEPDFSFYVFDLIDKMDIPFSQRLQRLQEKVMTGGRIVILPQNLISDETQLLDFEQTVLALGYEGLILRSVDGRYKQGRSTSKEGILLKLKRFTDSEAEIIGFEEEMRNDNVKTKNELGESERSSHQENLVPKGTLGALVARDLKTGIEFNIGTGFDAKDRADFWKDRSNLLGKIVKYKYFEVGVKDKPRHPVFLGFRDLRDM